MFRRTGAGWGGDDLLQEAPPQSSIRRSWSLRAAAPWLVALLLAALGTPPATATIYRYDTAAGGAIPETAATVAACVAGGLQRTFSVSESFTVSNVALGLNLSHASRGNVAALLYAPDGSYLVFVQPSFDTDDNYDILLSSDSDGGPTPRLDDNSADPVGEPYFARLVNQPAADFYTGNAQGTWTLVLCDVVSGTTGAFHRGRLVLTSTETVAPVCTGTTGYSWASNGNNQPFTSETSDGVTLGLTATRDLTNDGADTAGRVNFTTQTGVFGNQAGYYIMQFDDGANGAPQSPEQVLLESDWSFSSPVRQLSWTNLDIDNGAWEDYVRLTGRDANGAFVPYQLIPGTAHEPAGDVLESDHGNIPDNSTAGNATYLFAGPVSSVTLEYMRGDDHGNPNSQRIGIGDPSWCTFDFGDAPSSYGDALSDGPRHVLGTRSLYMGANPPDGEADGQPGSTATGDDVNQVGGVDDEDGVAGFPACPGDGTYTVDVNVTNGSGTAAYLVGYVDWNRDGVFDPATERSATVTVPNGAAAATAAVTWSGVPGDCGGSSSTYARFRLTTSQARAESPIDGPGLQAPDGEVEDYQIAAGTLPVTVAWVESARSAAGLDLHFATATESRNVAFRIWDLTPGHAPAPLAMVPSKVVDSFEPQEYEARLAAPGVERFGIEDIAVDGQGRLHGPFTVGRTVGARPVAAPIDWAEIRRETGVVSLADAVAAAQAAAPSSAGSGSRLALRQRPATGSAATGSALDRAGFGVPGQDGAALLLVHEEGIHRVTYEDLLAAGVDLTGVPAAWIAVTNDDQKVPAVVEPARPFGPGSFVEFLADPVLTLASPVDVYVLLAGPAAGSRQGPSVREVSDVGGGRPGTVRSEVRHHPDNKYSPSAPNGDPWYDARILALGGPGTLTRTFDLPDLADGPVALTLEVWGFAHFDGATPDHHLVVRLNGTELGSARFDGLSPWSKTFDVTGLVGPSSNTLEIEAPGDTGYDFDLVNLEGYSVDYPRTTTAHDGRFDAATPTGRRLGVTGFDAFAGREPVIGWFQKGSGAETRYARATIRSFARRVSVPPGARFVHLAAESRLLHPAIVPGVPAPETASAAEYLIITHPAFADSLDDLVSLERSRGFDTQVVTVDHIYAAYSDHQPSAEAIRSFIGASEERYPGKLRYVLFVGADTNDPYDHLGMGSISFVPTAYAAPVPDIFFGPTDELLVDGDGDGMGDVPVGRLPVHTPAELTTTVDKLYEWEARAAGGRDALLVAGASDSGRTLAEVNQSFADRLAGWDLGLAPVDDLGVPAVRAATLAALDAGTPIVSFVGHSSIGAWELTPILEWQDVASLRNSGQPNLVLQWGCWSSYYLHPAAESTSAALLLAPDAGAAGTIGATTLTFEDSHQRLGSLFFDQVAAGASTVGEALHAAKAALHREGKGRDAVLSMILLGDPAMSLPTGESGAPDQQ